MEIKRYVIHSDAEREVRDLKELVDFLEKLSLSLILCLIVMTIVLITVV